MEELSDALKRKLDLVLEEACRDLPNGGDHQSRKSVASLLLDAAQKGKTTLGELGMIARKAVAEISRSTER
jgi:hypothetical protein